MNELKLKELAEILQKHNMGFTLSYFSSIEEQGIITKLSFWHLSSNYEQEGFVVTSYIEDICGSLEYVIEEAISYFKEGWHDTYIMKNQPTKPN